MKAQEFDKKFDDGEDLTSYLDIKKSKKTSREMKRVNVDLPLWMIAKLDDEANRLGVTRQSIIKVWLADKLESNLQE
ncbi:MAG: BrnA antitoxin family protein [Candidatus Kapabacteria bacterium]|nr:BrnA antitoxin family protein [Candidatus Kapabacteria bacterium]